MVHLQTASWDQRYHLYHSARREPVQLLYLYGQCCCQRMQYPGYRYRKDHLRKRIALHMEQCDIRCCRYEGYASDRCQRMRLYSDDDPHGQSDLQCHR